ncbi:MAG: lysophospholipid acyltransferase family protein [Polyangiaceae bacterium]
MSSLARSGAPEQTNSEGETPRRDLLSAAEGKVSWLEHLQMRVIRKSFEPGLVDRLLRWGQRQIGQRWIHLATSRLHHVHHLERVLRLGAEQSFILVANHRSFFDLYVVTATLVRSGLRQRIVFPVRATFFYDRVLGFFVNGVMSFFAMYPPVFRDARLAQLNLLGLDEVKRLLQARHTLVGIHPEGQRNKTDDPYTFLPAQSGVGRIVYGARVPVIPVFVNGLLPKDLPRQIVSNFDGSGIPIHTVFGDPIDFGGLLDEPASPRVYKKLAERCLEAVQALSLEEKAFRASAPAPPPQSSS